MTTLQDVGEFGVVDRIASIVGQGTAVVGIGDDAAVLENNAETYLLVTTDMLVSDVHFQLDTTMSEDLGRRALAVNCSDIAAMGGIPTYAVFSLAAHPTMPVTYLEGIYRGAVRESASLAMSIVGGNLTRIAKGLVIDVTVIGIVPQSDVVLRSGALPGDLLAVTGQLGRSAAERLRPAGSVRTSGECGAPPVAYIPVPRVREGRQVASKHLVHAMMDISDGVAGDIHQLTRASNVGAIIRLAGIPVAPEAHEVASRLGRDPHLFALTEGEDYELLMALPPRLLDAAREAVLPTPLHVIGMVVPPEDGVTLESIDGRQEPFTLSGWTHF